MADEEILSRFFQLKSQGVPLGEAWERSRIEHALKSWPDHWGDYLHVSLYGAIDISDDIDVPGLGIHISSKKEEGDFIFGSPFCYDCQIKVMSRDIKGLMDAINRLETLLNLCSVAMSFSGSSPTKGAGSSIHYYCRFLCDPTTVALNLNEHMRIVGSLFDASKRFTGEQYRILSRAAWWIRQARHDILSGNTNPSIFAIYSSYWNALECLIDLVCQVVPLKKLSKPEKRLEVEQFFNSISGTPMPEDVQKCYHEIINPGVKGKAQHALKTACSPDIAAEYYEECFTRQPSEDRLYQIRNDIDHGNIVEFDFQTRLRVINGLNKLEVIILALFSFLANPNSTFASEQNEQDEHTPITQTFANTHPLAAGSVDRQSDDDAGGGRTTENR